MAERRADARNVIGSSLSFVPPPTTPVAKIDAASKATPGERFQSDAILILFAVFLDPASAPKTLTPSP